MLSASMESVFVFLRDLLRTNLETQKRIELHKGEAAGFKELLQIFAHSGR